MSTAARAKFIEHMKLAGFSEHSQRSYINGVKGLANYYNQSPERLTNGQVHMYFRYLVLERKLSWATCSSYLCGILYFF